MKTIFSSFLLLLSLVLTAQPSPYLSDLTALKSFVEKTASFKDQIKGEKKADFNALYARLASDTISNPESFTYFYNLSQLIFPLRDNHIGFYRIPNYEPFRTKERIDSFVATKEFQDYPTTSLDLDSLRVILSNKPIESVEGIYHYDTFYTVGLFKNNDQEYIGVILDSKLNFWKSGNIAIHLYETAQHTYKAIYGHPYFKHFILQPIEKYQNQTLVNSYFYGSFSQSVYAKKLEKEDYSNLPKDGTKFAFKNIDEKIQYVLIRSFQTNPKIAQASQLFYDSIKNQLVAPNLIVDLRNNEGGADKEMTKFLKLLKGYLKIGKLYLLVNNATLSQAELFTLELKQQKNVFILGQQTKGMLAYGSNYGKYLRLPSAKFEFYQTDMNNGSTALQYEDSGISPDYFLTNRKDWIEQTIDFIGKR